MGNGRPHNWLSYNVRNVSLRQPFANVRTVAVTERVVHYSCGQRGVFNRQKRSSNRPCCYCPCTCVFERLRSIEDNEKFILNGEDDASGERTTPGVALSAAKALMSDLGGLCRGVPEGRSILSAPQAL